MSVSENMPNYYGSSLSERMHQPGIGQRFYSAVDSKNISQVKTLLQSINFSEHSIDVTIKNILG